MNDLSKTVVILTDIIEELKLKVTELEEKSQSLSLQWFTINEQNEDLLDQLKEAKQENYVNDELFAAMTSEFK